MDTTKETVPKNMQFSNPQKELVKKLATQYSDIEEAYSEFKESYPWYHCRKYFYIEVDKLLKTNFLDSYKPMKRERKVSSKRRSRISLTVEQFKEMYILVLKGKKTIAQVMKDAGYSNESGFYYYKNKYYDQIPHSIKEVGGIEKEETEQVWKSSDIIKEDKKVILEQQPYNPVEIDAIKNEINNTSLESSLRDIENEVNSVLEKKYKSLNCYLEREYNIDDYINMFDLLLYLANNHESIRTKSLNQSDIGEHYVRDIEHAIEIEAEKDYNNLDRIKYSRNRRRQAKETYEDMNLLSNYLNIVNKKELEKVIKLLKDKKEQRSNTKYTPRVDKGMVKRYNWCTYGNIDDKVSNTPLLTTTDKKIQKTIKSDDELKKAKVILSTYRVKIEIWGYKGEPFYNEMLEFQVNSEQQAREKAESYMKKRLNYEKVKNPFFIMDVYKLP